MHSILHGQMGLSHMGEECHRIRLKPLEAFKLFNALCHVFDVHEKEKRPVTQRQKLKFANTFNKKHVMRHKKIEIVAFNATIKCNVTVAKEMANSIHTFHVLRKQQMQLSRLRR